MTRMRSFFSEALFFTGIGAALGVLFAPRKGCESRERLAAWLEDIRCSCENCCAQWKDRMHAEGSARKPCSDDKEPAEKAAA